MESSTLEYLQNQSEPSFIELELGHLLQVFIHAGVGLDFGSGLVLLDVVGAVGVDLHLGLPVFGAGEVFLQLDADELPLLRLLADLGGGVVLELLLRVRVVLVGEGVLVGGVLPLGPYGRPAVALLDLEAQVELLLVLGGGVGVRLRLPVVLLQVEDVGLFQMPELLHLAAVGAVALPAAGLVRGREAVEAHLRLLVAVLDGLPYLSLFFGEEGGLEGVVGGGVLGLVAVAGVGVLAGVGLGVVFGAVLLLFDFGLEEVKRLIHRLPMNIITTNPIHPHPHHPASIQPYSIFLLP